MKKFFITAFLVLFVTVLGSMTFSKSSISSLISENVKAYSEGEDFSKMRETVQYVFSEISLHFDASIYRELTDNYVDISTIINSIDEVYAGLQVDFWPNLAIIISCKNAWFHRNCNPSSIGVWQASSDYSSLTPVRLAF